MVWWGVNVGSYNMSDCSRNHGEGSLSLNERPPPPFFAVVQHKVVLFKKLLGCFFPVTSAFDPSAIAWRG